MTGPPREPSPEPSRADRRILALRRWTSRHRRPLAALSAALTAASVIAAVRPPEPPRAHVLVAARDLPGGVALSRHDLTRAAVPVAALPRGALRTAGQAAGRVLASPARAGEVLTDVRLLGRGLLRGYGPGLVAAPVRIADPGVAALLAPGDRVDVLAAGPPGTPPLPDPSATGFGPSPGTSGAPPSSTTGEPPFTAEPPASATTEPPATATATATAEPPASATAEPRTAATAGSPSLTGADLGPSPVTWTVVRGVRVLAVPRVTEPGPALDLEAPGRLVLLVATPEQAAALAQAAQTARLSVTIADRTDPTGR